jgi:hypothetical protein
MNCQICGGTMPIHSQTCRLHEAEWIMRLRWAIVQRAAQSLVYAASRMGHTKRTAKGPLSIPRRLISHSANRALQWTKKMKTCKCGKQIADNASSCAYCGLQFTTWQAVAFRVGLPLLGLALIIYSCHR